VIPDPRAHPASLGVQKVPGYDPAHDYNSLTNALGTTNVPGNEAKCEFVFLVLCVFPFAALTWGKFFLIYSVACYSAA
jgi:hypothetical protein